MLKWNIKLAAVALVISLSGTPVIACLVPDSTESVEARECCRKMADQCGDMGMMPSTHSCCKVTTHRTDSYVVKSRFTSGHDQHLFTPPIAPTNDFTLRIFSQAGSVAQAHSPPVSRADTISILRI